ncbi:hypothetical protein NIES2098_23600 [Calothrix sp. NIES-2098]|nr:hypothetical protein NIES2098_23600 [Calothrix sp. NIES-2098]
MSTIIPRQITFNFVDLWDSFSFTSLSHWLK